jgi:AbrB family looped-hinge helix DNA binding protein
MKSTVRERGQVTIPKPLRDRMGIKAGQRVEIEEQNGELVLRKVFEDDPIAGFQRRYFDALAVIDPSEA